MKGERLIDLLCAPFDDQGSCCAGVVASIRYGSAMAGTVPRHAKVKMENEEAGTVRMSADAFTKPPRDS